MNYFIPGCYLCLGIVDLLIDPFPELRYPGEDSVTVVRVAFWTTPADSTLQKPTAVLVTANVRTTAVSMTTTQLSPSSSSAEHFWGNCQCGGTLYNQKRLKTFCKLSYKLKCKLSFTLKWEWKWKWKWRRRLFHLQDFLKVKNTVFSYLILFSGYLDLFDVNETLKYGVKLCTCRKL